MDKEEVRQLMAQIYADIELSNHRLDQAKRDARFWGFLCCVCITVILGMAVAKFFG
jgi:hypothetical protein